MTDNIFEIETTALAHVACAPQGSSIQLTDFAAAYPSVNHSWIFSMIEKTELHDFISRFLRSIYNDRTTHVEFAGATRRQFLMARGVRQGCPASACLQWHLTRSLDGSKRWFFQGILTIWNSCSLPNVRTLMTYFAVASLSCRALMSALAPAFRSVDYIAGANLNFHKCCWVQCGTEGRESLCYW